MIQMAGRKLPTDGWFKKKKLLLPIVSHASSTAELIRQLCNMDLKISGSEVSVSLRISFHT